MSDLDEDSADAVERLSFFMLREAYFDVSAVLRTVDSDLAHSVFEKIEQKAEAAFQRIYKYQLEGPSSTAIVTATAELLVPILDSAHTEPLGPRVSSYDAFYDENPEAATLGNVVITALADQAKSKAA